MAINARADQSAAEIGHVVSQQTRSVLKSTFSLTNAILNAWRRPWADLGIVAGTAVTRVVLPWRGLRVQEPSYMAVDPVDNRVVSVGQEARKMEGRAPVPIAVLHPFAHSVVNNFEAAAQFLKALLRKSNRGLHLAGPRVVVAVPSDATPLERLGLREAMEAAGACGVLLVDQSLAAAIGAGVDLSVPRGAMVVNIGAGTTQITVTAMGGVALNRCIRVGGGAMDRAICAYLKKQHHVWIGERTAEELKWKLGSAIPLDPPESADIGGRDLFTGVPRTITVTSDEICAVLQDILEQMVEEIRQAVAGVSSRMVADILKEGIQLTGGASRLRGLDTFISSKVGVPATVLPEPETRMALGLQRMLEDKSLLRMSLLREGSPHGSQTETAPELRLPRARPLRFVAGAAALLALLGFAVLRPPVPHSFASTSADAPVEGVLAPIMNRSLQTMRNVSAWAHALWEGVQINQALRDEVPLLEAQLDRSNADTRWLMWQNKQLSSLLNLPAWKSSKGIPAHILLRDPTAWLTTVHLDRGAEDGVKPGLAVICAGGLVGQVVWAGPNSSKVRLLTGQSAIVACKVKDRNAAGVLYGAGEETCELRFIDPDAPIKVGDEVITSGLDAGDAGGVPGGVYPAGIIVGHITQVYPARETVYRSARVKPSAPLDSATVVLLLPGAR